MDDFTSIQYRRRLAQITGITIMNEEQIDEDFEVGRKVNVTNPNATPRYKITGKDETHYYLEGPDEKPMKLPKERIQRVNKVNEEQIEEVEKPTTNDDHKRKAALNLYHRMVGDSLRSGETYPRAHQIGVAMVEHDHGQFGLDHLKNHFKEMKKHAKHLSVD